MVRVKSHRTYKLYGRRTSDPLVTPRNLNIDLQLAQEMLESSLIRNRGLCNASPKGECYECGKKVTGERKLCGRCAAR